MRVLIAGGGIGGMTAALFLRRAGIEAHVFERANEIRELGVGINMLPHAVRALAGLGLAGALEKTGIRVEELIYANRFGQTVWHEKRGVSAGHQYPQISLHRGRLLSLIHRALVDQFGPGVVTTGVEVLGFSQDSDGVTLALQRRDGARDRLSGDVVVGADGIHSALRRQLYPREGAPVWNGVMLWRGCTSWPIWKDGRTMVVAGGNDAKFLFYPIARDPADPDRRLTNWAVMARTGAAGAAPRRRENWSRHGLPEDVLPFVCDRFAIDFIDPPSMIAATDTFYEYPNCDRDPLPRWSFGRATLLGDAAHPMYPVGSNGASQAILDAKSLAAQLTSPAPVATALKAYEEERRAATSGIVLSNRQGGPERVIDLIERRAPGGFDSVDQIAPRAEREAIVRGYAELAGFAQI